MAYCTKCGAEIEENAKFCSSCGSPVGNTENANNQGASKVNEFINDFTNTADTTSQFTQDDISKNKGMGILAYLSILVLIPIFAAKDSKFARFHANQGLLLLIASIATSLISNIVGILNLSLFGVIFSIFFGLVDLLILALAIIGIVNAAQGKAKDLPIIGNIRIL